MIGIRFHGRGGQGAVIASKILANAYFKQGLYVQAFPSFGMERKGALVLLPDWLEIFRFQTYWKLNGSGCPDGKSHSDFKTYRKFDSGFRRRGVFNRVHARCGITPGPANYD